jgi:hypothetical protein
MSGVGAGMYRAEIDDNDWVVLRICYIICEFNGFLF